VNWPVLCDKYEDAQIIRYQYLIDYVRVGDHHSLAVQAPFTPMLTNFLNFIASTSVVFLLPQSSN
jgi:hypothetical protein